MNSLWVTIGCLFFLYLSYKIYGRLIDKDLITPKTENTTPAHTLKDGIDFYPAKRIMLFGHHFASIAGIGPIVGPVIGVFYFGWLAGLFWILIGSVFIGGIHDYIVLMMSTRHEGVSVAELANRTLGSYSRFIFSAFLWLALVLIIAIFAVYGAKTLVDKPHVVLPAVSLVPIAMLIGWMIYVKKWPVTITTFLGLILLVACIWFGEKFPVAVEFMDPLNFWFTVLIIYAVIASVVPVWLILQPRDYLSSYLLFVGLGIGLLGLTVARPEIKAPAFTTTVSNIGPIWPMLFVVVACGAVSGFHSLVCGGTTSKQLSNESHGRFIGYGAMLFEAVLAILAIMCVSAAINWEEFRTITGPGGGGNLVAFATGYGKLAGTLPFINGETALQFALVMVNAFILTTLDTTVRLSRLIVTESAPKKLAFLRTKKGALLLTLAPVLYLGYTGQWKFIWPVFGAANQLIAALALLVATAYLLGIKKKTVYTFVPTLVMLVTTVAALIWNIYSFLFVSEPAKFLLAGISLALLVLAFFMVYESRHVFKKILMQKTEKIEGGQYAGK